MGNRKKFSELNLNNAFLFAAAMEDAETCRLMFEKIFLNTKGTNDNEVPRVLIQFLEYLENSTESYVEKTGSEQVRKLHNKIANLKKNHVLEEKYMTMEELLRQEYRKGTEEGYVEGSERMIKLTMAMAADGMVKEINRLLTEPVFLEEMLKKYEL